MKQYTTIKDKNYLIINRNTKKADELLTQYENSNNYSVFDCYNSPSRTKEQIENSIFSFMHDNNLGGYKVLTYCIMNFKVGYKDDKYLYIETHANNYAIPLI